MNEDIEKVLSDEAERFEKERDVERVYVRAKAPAIVTIHLSVDGEEVAKVIARQLRVGRGLF